MRYVPQDKRSVTCGGLQDDQIRCSVEADVAIYVERNRVIIVLSPEWSRLLSTREKKSSWPGLGRQISVQITMPENKTSSGSVKFAKDIFAGTCGRLEFAAGFSIQTRLTAHLAPLFRWYCCHLNRSSL